MNAPALALRHRLGRASRTVRFWLAPRPIILMYHRVIDLAFDPQLLAVGPRHFREHLEILRTAFQPVSLADLVSRLDERRLPRRAVVVTIDDGYADTLEQARPLLERFEIPATVFVTTGYLGGTREFWWDELERLVLGPGRLPKVLRLTIGSRVHEWKLGQATDDPGPGHGADPRWNVERGDDPGPRHELYRSLYSMLHPLPDNHKWAVLDELRRIVGTHSEGRPTHRTLTPDELTRLADGDLVEIGAHSMTHAALAGLPDLVQQHEIAGSRQVLEELLSRPVAGFAFPHGSYTAVTMAAVRDAGFRRACTSDPELVGPDADPLRLPRIVPRDWDGDQFARWLRGWVG